MNGVARTGADDGRGDRAFRQGRPVGQRDLSTDPVTVQAVTRSIRDLGVLLHEAGSDEARAWLVLRLGNRLDVLEALMARGGRLRGVTQ